MVFWFALIAVVLVSCLSLLGAMFVKLENKLLEKIITVSLAFSSGVLLGASLLELLPESVHDIGDLAYPWVLVGLITFFCLEKLISWHHHIEGDVHEGHKAVAYLTLIGDSIHNFTDGAVIAGAYLVSVPLGITTTVAIIAHEIPHELSDFLVLIHGGFSYKNAIQYNFISATTAVMGMLLFFFFAAQYRVIEQYMLPFAAGNFIYIAASDLIPELLKKRQGTTSLVQVIVLILGVCVLPLIHNLLGT